MPRGGFGFSQTCAIHTTTGNRVKLGEGNPMTESCPRIKTEAGGEEVTPVVLTDAQKESIKLRATYCNGLAVGIAVAGAFTSVSGLLFTARGILGGNPFTVMLLCAAACAAIIFSADFHWDARKIIAKLDGPDAKPDPAEETSYRAFQTRLRNISFSVSAIFVVVSLLGWAAKS